MSPKKKEEEREKEWSLFAWSVEERKKLFEEE
jgi:hypothetical protein